MKLQDSDAAPRQFPRRSEFSRTGPPVKLSSLFPTANEETRQDLLAQNAHEVANALSP